ncbi:MAG: endo-1,4-beta-xylanase [Prolixibacteraceae bacterium]|nr:endo-1,4-beta-xylanase [Prolixibacteraceae bacterium]
MSKFQNIFLIVCLCANVALFGQTTTVKPIADGNEKFLGCAWSNTQNLNFQNYWNQVSPENGGKWGSVEGTRNVMNWSDMDAAYSLAQKYGMSFKEHTLIWGAQQPSWIANLDTASQRQEIEQWFSLMAARYKNIKSIDVVNEPIHNAPNGMLPWGSSTKNVDYAKALGGAGKTGWDWIIKAFRMARKYFPNSKLILNEYSVINSSSKTQEYLKIIKLLQAENLIDGIGEQAHAFTTYGTSATTMKANLDVLGATGLPIYLTEMDIDGTTDYVQLKEMQRVFPVFWKHPSVKGITMWGFRYGLWRTKEGAYLVNQNGTERAALKWLRAYVNDTVVNTQSITVSASDGSTTISTKGASLNMVAQVLPLNTTIPNVNWTVSPTYMATIDAAGKLTALADGKVTVTATAWDASGAKGTASITISNQTTGLPEGLLADQISVFPNPAANGCFTIDGIDEIQEIEMIDLAGRRIVSYTNLDQSSLQLQVDIPEGMYILNLKSDKLTIQKKISIRK